MLKTLKTPQKTPQKLLEAINKYSKVTGYKINVQKSTTFLYVNNEILTLIAHFGVVISAQQTRNSFWKCYLCEVQNFYK